MRLFGRLIYEEAHPSRCPAPSSLAKHYYAYCKNNMAGSEISPPAMGRTLQLAHLLVMHASTTSNLDRQRVPSYFVALNWNGKKITAEL